MSTVWGVDTATTVTSSYLDCIESNYGVPTFIGRYLKTVPSRSDGLTSSEVSLIHDKNISIALIWNSFDGSTVSTYAQGKSVATAAIDWAYSTGNLYVPAGTAIFADLEQGYSVTADWIRGWVDTFYSYNPSGAPSPEYLPGMYANLEYGTFPSAFCEAVASDTNVPLAYIWANNASAGLSTKANAPISVSPPSNLQCNGLIVGWQYGINGNLCSTGPIDTDVWDPSYASVFG